jgi:hypothetical protein
MVALLVANKRKLQIENSLKKHLLCCYSAFFFAGTFRQIYLFVFRCSPQALTRIPVWPLASRFSCVIPNYGSVVSVTEITILYPISNPNHHFSCPIPMLLYLNKYVKGLFHLSWWQPWFDGPNCYVLLLTLSSSERFCDKFDNLCGTVVLGHSSYLPLMFDG